MQTTGIDLKEQETRFDNHTPQSVCKNVLWSAFMSNVLLAFLKTSKSPFTSSSGCLEMSIYSFSFFNKHAMYHSYFVVFFWK